MRPVSIDHATTVYISDTLEFWEVYRDLRGHQPIGKIIDLGKYANPRYRMCPQTGFCQDLAGISDFRGAAIALYRRWSSTQPTSGGAA